MVVIENDCVGCADVIGTCLGPDCPNRHVPHYYCDKCGEEEDLYEFEGEELCIDCIEKMLVKVN